MFLACVLYAIVIKCSEKTVRIHLNFTDKLTKSAQKKWYPKISKPRHVLGMFLNFESL